ncbi:helix-turn-helix domain-containing protein [Actinomadura sp. DSM 109109]|nr:helix-turn-helix domain-containing protein [Actinomadura lepetitiana]
MESHDSLDPRSSLWDLVAVQLRLLRLNHGWTCQQVGDAANASRSHVSNWEAGRRRPNQANLAPLDEAWDTAGLLTSLAEHAKDGHDRPRVGAFLQYERDATSIRNYSSDVIPGLLQTEGYARSLFQRGGVVDDVERAVSDRLERQKPLYGANPPHLWVIIAQPVLWWQVGEGASLMRDQNQPSTSSNAARPRESARIPGLRWLARRQRITRTHVHTAHRGRVSGVRPHGQSDRPFARNTRSQRKL